MREDLGDLNEDWDYLEQSVERLDNDQKRNNLKIRELKEGAEGKDLVGFLTKLFTSWAGVECSLDISIEAAYHLRRFRTTAKFPRDVIVKFLLLANKAKVWNYSGNNQK